MEHLDMHDLLLTHLYLLSVEAPRLTPVVHVHRLLAVEFAEGAGRLAQHNTVNTIHQDLIMI